MDGSSKPCPNCGWRAAQKGPDEFKWYYDKVDLSLGGPEKILVNVPIVVCPECGIHAPWILFFNLPF
jgi:predicted RNA-binding Zn-ribbon protein involved in translation (DUF1610 family)